MNRAELDTAFIERCIATLEYSMSELKRHDPKELAYDSARASCVKGFELVLEQCASLLRVKLGAYFEDRSEASRLSVKDRFRQAAKLLMIDSASVERWFEYRDHRNKTAHEYGANYADAVVELLPGFIADARRLVDALKEVKDE